MIEQAHDMIEATTNVWIRTIVYLTDMSMDTYDCIPNRHVITNV